MFVILLNCLTLGMYQPCVDDECKNSKCKILQVFDDLIFVFFTTEMSIKMVAMGVYGKGAYLADSWNKLDFFIVVAGSFEYFLQIDKFNLTAIRTIRVLRPLRAINRIPSNVLLLCFFVFFIFGIIGVQLWEGILRQRCVLQLPPQISAPNISFYYEFSKEQDYICSKPDDSGMHRCENLPPLKIGNLVCNDTPVPYSMNLPTPYSCINWNKFYSNCSQLGRNPFKGTMSFDNIGLAWTAIFLVISLEGWTDIMYYIQDAHSFWDWIYFVLLIVIGSFFMINLCLVVIATQFSETKKREMERMRQERSRFTSSSTLTSGTNNSEPSSCYKEIIKGVLRIWKRYHKKITKKCQYKLCCFRIRSQCMPETTNLIKAHHPNCPQFRNILEKSCLHQQYNGKLLKVEDINFNRVPGAASIKTRSLLVLKLPNAQEAANLVENLKILDETINKCGRRSSMVINEYIILKVPAANTKITANSRIRSIENLNQSGASGIWKVNMAHQTCNRSDQISGSMTCQELLAFSATYSAALVTGRSTLDCLYQSIVKMGNFDFGISYYVPVNDTCCTMFHYSNIQHCLLGPFFIILKSFRSIVILLRKFVKMLVDHKYFQQGILMAILVNTLSMGVEYHNQPEELTSVVEMSNLFFSIIFAIEMALKVFAEGPLKYISNGFNVFDGIIVVLSAIEITQGDTNGGQVTSGLSVLRTFRLLRILKLVRFMPNLRRQLFVMLRTMDNVAVFFSLLVLFIFIFSILGMYLFGGKFCKFTDGDVERDCSCFEIVNKSPFCECDRKHFNNILWSTVTVFQILTQEDWNVVLFNGMEKTSHWAALYFVALMTFGNYVLFNLLVAILVEGFSSERNERKEREQRDFIRNKLKDQKFQKELHEIFQENSSSESSFDETSSYVNNHIKRMSVFAPRITTTAATPQDSPNGTSKRKYSLTNDVELLYPPNLIQFNSNYKRELIQLSGGGKCAMITSDGKEGPIDFHTLFSNNDHVLTIRSNFDNSCHKQCSAYNRVIKPSRKTEETNEKISETEINIAPQKQKCVIFNPNILDIFTFPFIEEFKKNGEQKSLYFFAKDDRLRRSCTWLISKPWCDNIVLFFIALNCITLAMERPNIPPRCAERIFLTTANYVFTGAFAIEMLIKVIADGLFYGNKAYFTSGWNVMDGTLVTISIIDLLMSILSESSPKIFGILRVFRLLRSLRPLRVINRAPGLKLVVQTLLSSLRPIGNIVLICCTFFIIFGILGVQLFKGTFYYCEGENVKDVTNKTECLERGNVWINRKYNFDDLGKALMSLFVLSSRDGWVNIMYTGLDSVGVDIQPVVNYNEWRLLYFISFILLVGFFVLNMFVGVVVENFHRCREEQEKEERIRRAAKRALQIKRRQNQPVYYANYEPTRLFIHEVVTSKYFDLAIAAVIGLNVVSMAMEYYMMPLALEYTLKIFNYFFTAVFIVEAIMKVCALGPLMYLKDKWNQLDVYIVLFSILGIVLEELETNIIPINPTIIRVMRVLRIARVLKLLKMAKGIRALLDTVMQALPQVGNLGLLFFLLFFIFAALGVELFGRLECSEKIPCQGLGEHAHFANFGMAFLTLFRVATGDNWNGIMKDTLRDDCNDNPDCVKNCCVNHLIAPIFFVIFVLMAQFVLVNVVVAVLMKHLEESHKQIEDDEFDDDIERLVARNKAKNKNDSCIINDDKNSNSVFIKKNIVKETKSSERQAIEKPLSNHGRSYKTTASLTLNSHIEEAKEKKQCFEESENSLLLPSISFINPNSINSKM